MGLVTIHDVGQGTDAWHKLRSGLYTGSNAWKLLKYGAIDYALTQQSSFSGNYFTKRGAALEPECIELYEAIAKSHVQRPGFVTNSDFPTAGYSPDGLTDNTLIEVKCFNEKRHLAIYDGGVPFEIQAQIYFGMLLTEFKKAKLLIYNPDLEDPKKCFKIIDIPYNRNIQNNFKRILRKETYAA